MESSTQKKISDKNMIDIILDLTHKNDILFTLYKNQQLMIEKQKGMIDILQADNNSKHQELTNKLIEHKTYLENFEKSEEKEIGLLNNKTEEHEKEIRKLNAKINLFSYRDSV